MVTGFSATVRRVIRDRSDGWCEICGKEHAAHFHHRRARGMGGTKRPETNQPAACLHLCPGCHERVESHRVWALDMGWLVRQNTNPADVSVLYRGTQVWLDDLGNLREVAA